MANVTNNHDSAVTVGGLSIRAGATAKIPNWPVVCNTGNTQQLIAMKILTVSIGDYAPVAEEKQANVSSEKAAIIADMEVLGMIADKRKSITKLRAELDAATALDDQQE